MNCDQARLLLTDRWVTGIEEDQRLLLDQHLAACTACRDEARTLDLLWNGLGDLPIEEPGKELRANVHHMLDSYRLGAQSAPRPKPRHSFYQYAAIAAAAAIIGIATGHFYTARVHDRQQIAQLTTEMQSMRQLVALSLLQQQSASDRLRGVSYSVRLEPADREVLSALFQTLNHDASVNVRLAAVDALKQFASQPPVRQSLRQAMLQQDSPLVQVALIDWAVEANDRPAIDLLRQMERGPALDPSVRQRLMSAISSLQSH